MRPQCHVFLQHGFWCACHVLPDLDPLAAIETLRACDFPSFP